MLSFQKKTHTANLGDTDTKKLEKSFSRQVLKPPSNIHADIELVEYSMVPEMKESLAAKLDPFLRGEKNEVDNAVELKTIILKHLPKSMIHFLDASRTQRESEIPAKVCVVRNLPEASTGALKASELLSNYDGPTGGLSEKHRPFLLNDTYASWIQKGLGLVLGMEPSQVDIIRTHNGYIQSGELHLDEEPITALAGIYDHQEIESKTRFVDLASCRDTLGYSLPLGHKDVTILGPIDEATVTPNAVDYSVNNGAIAFWSNRGRIAHQALPSAVSSTVELSDKDVTRIILVAFFREKDF